MGFMCMLVVHTYASTKLNYILLNRYRSHIALATTYVTRTAFNFYLNSFVDL